MPAPRYYRAVGKRGLFVTAWTEYTNVLTLSIDIGKKSILDTVGPSQATFTYRRVDASTPVPSIGDTIYLVDYTTGTTAQQIAQNNDLMFVGKVSDAAIDWTINSSGDTISVNCEGYLADMGRNTLNAVSFSSTTLSSYITNLNTASGQTAVLYNAGANETLAAETWSQSAADLLRTISTTVYGRCVELDGAVALLAKNYTQTASWKFSDAASGTYQTYDDLRYESLANNYYTKILVNYPTNQTASVGTGDRVLTLDTLAKDATAATTLGNFYKNAYGTPVMGLAVISASASSQGTFRLGKISTLGSYQAGIYNCVGTELNVDFRGSTLTVIVEGVSISADPTDSRFTFYVSPGDLNSYLILNNTVLGRLNYNKLGF